MQKTNTALSTSIILSGILLIFSQSAVSHVRWSLTGLVKPRSNSTGLKEPAPCGGVARTQTPVVLKSGNTIDVQFEETINHPGYFRIAFSPASDTGFDENIIIANIPEVPATRFYTQTISLPDIECNDCTLQLIQVMTDRSPPSNYYSCADIQLTSNGTLPQSTNDITPPLDVSDYTLVAGDSEVTLSWENPALDFSKALILQGTSQITGTPVTAVSYNVNDTIDNATIIYSGNDTTYFASNLNNGSQYFFKIFAFDANFNYSAGTELNTSLPTIPENSQPVVLLTSEQALVETHRISNSAGNVIIQASITDNNPSDTHQFNWSMTDNRLIDVDDIASNFTFNPTELEAGTYIIQVTATDNGIPAKVGSATMSIEVIDTPGSGITSGSSSSGGGMHLIIFFFCFMSTVFRTRTQHDPEP